MRQSKKLRTWYKYAVITRHGDIMHVASSDRPPHHGQTKIGVRIVELSAAQERAVSRPSRLREMPAPAPQEKPTNG